MTSKVRIATTSLAGCFGCHMSLLDIDERILPLLSRVEFDRSPLTDQKHAGPCAVGLIEGGVCNEDNLHVLKEFRAQCTVLVAVGACAINGGLPAQRNHFEVGDLLRHVYFEEPGLTRRGVPNRFASTGIEWPTGFSNRIAGPCARSTRSQISVISRFVETGARTRFSSPSFSSCAMKSRRSW